MAPSIWIILQIFASAIAKVPNVCRDGWINKDNSCYHVSREPASWQEAQTMCQLHGESHLVNIESAAEQSFLENLLHTVYGSDSSHDYWAGGSDWESDGNWVWEPDYIAFTYTNWFPGQPNNGRYNGHNIHEPGFDDQNCLLLRYNHSFQWIDSVCSDKHFYVCETAVDGILTTDVSTPTVTTSIKQTSTTTRSPKETTSTKQTPYGSKVCRDGWINKDKSCYHVTRAPASWQEAQTMCQLHGESHLVNIESAAEQSFLENLVHTVYGSDASHDYWTGGSDWNSEGNWVWEPHNTAFTYTDWFLGQPNNGRYPGHDIHELGFYDHNCLLLRYNHSFQWIDTICSDKHFYVCETDADIILTNPGNYSVMSTVMPASTSTTAPKKTTRTQQAAITSMPMVCSDGWINKYNSCYHVTRAPASWYEAQTMCELHDSSHLVNIESAAEQSFLTNLLHAVYGNDASQDYWTGGSDWESEGKWVWEPNDIAFRYTNWFPGQPNNGRYNGNDVHEPGFEDENCLLLRYNHSFQWIDTACRDKHFYVCEKDVVVIPTNPTVPSVIPTTVTTAQQTSTTPPPPKKTTSLQETSSTTTTTSPTPTTRRRNPTSEIIKSESPVTRTTLHPTKASPTARPTQSTLKTTLTMKTSPKTRTTASMTTSTEHEEIVLIGLDAAGIKATSSFQAGIDQIDIECRPPTNWTSITSTIFAIQLMRNTSQTPNHNVVSVYQGSNIAWQDSSVQQRATVSGQTTNAKTAFLKLTIPAYNTQPIDAAEYTCQVAGLNNFALENRESKVNVSLIVPKVCRDGWINENNSCYHVNRGPATWQEAQTICEQHGNGHLVHIESANEQAFLENLLHTTYGIDAPKDYWAGGSDWESEGNWVWEPDNIAFTYTDWFPGQPNNGRYHGHNIHEQGYDDHNCLLLRYNHTFQWIDTVCGDKHFYVCEAIQLKLPTRATPPPTTVNTVPLIIGK